MSLFPSQEPSSPRSSPPPEKRARTTQETNVVEQKEGAAATTRIVVRMDDFYESFPPGFKFRPTDRELILYYLKKKTKNQRMPENNIREVLLHNYNPEQLTDMYPPSYGENEWYFFVLRYRKYRNGTRPSRAAGNGYWKATGADKPIYQKEKIIGYRKALVFYVGPAQKGEKTDWMLHEFRVEKDDTESTKREQTDVMLDQWVLCKIYKKSDRPRRTAYNEETQEEHADDDDDLCDADDQHSLPVSGSNISNSIETECSYDGSIVSYTEQGNPFGADEFSGLRNPHDEIGCSDALQHNSTGLRNLVGENESGHALQHNSSGLRNLVGKSESNHALQYRSTRQSYLVGEPQSLQYNYIGHINPVGDQFVPNLSPQCGYTGNLVREFAPNHALEYSHIGNPLGESVPNHAPEYSYIGNPFGESVPNHAPQCSYIGNPVGESVPSQAPQYSYIGDPVGVFAPNHVAPQCSHIGNPVGESVPNHVPQYSYYDYPRLINSGSGNESRYALQYNTTLMNPEPYHVLTGQHPAKFINSGHENIDNSAKPIFIEQPMNPTNPTKDIDKQDSSETGHSYCDDIGFELENFLEVSDFFDVDLDSSLWSDSTEDQGDVQKGDKSK